MARSSERLAVLRAFLPLVEPKWGKRDLQAVLDKLAKVGVNGLEDLLRLLDDAEQGSTSAKAKHRLNRLLQEAGEKCFASSTLGAMQALSSSFSADGVLRVSLGNLAGEVVELEVASNCVAFDVKARAGEIWRTPVECQQAVVGSTVLSDTDFLVAHLVPGATTLTVTTLVSLDRLSQDLGPDSGPIRKLTALNVLPRLPAAGYRFALDMATTHMENDQDENVRRAAMLAYSKLVPKGDSAAIERIIQYLVEGGSAGVRESAAEALGEVGQRGDVAIQQFLQALLTDTDSSVRAAAAQALARVATPGDRTLIDQLYDALQDEDDITRLWSLEAIAGLVDRGDNTTTAALLNLATDPNPNVRQKVMQLLGNIADLTDERVSAAAYDAFLGDDNLGVRKAAWDLCQRLELNAVPV